jgi:hypothetical protein
MSTNPTVTSMTYILSALLITFFSFSVKAELYKYYDDRGRVNFTNIKPHDKKVETLENKNSNTDKNYKPISNTPRDGLVIFDSDQGFSNRITNVILSAPEW